MKMLIPEKTRRSVWAALGTKGRFTLHNLVEITASPVLMICEYINALMGHGYISIVATRRSVSGEWLPVFATEKYTGPEAPYVDDRSRFIDPNLVNERKSAAQGWAETIVRSDRVISTPASRMLVLLGRSGEAFSKSGAEFAWKAAGEPQGNFSITWIHLQAKGRVTRPKGELWEIAPHPLIDGIREYLRDHISEYVTNADLRHLTTSKRLQGKTIGAALKLLAAEGFEVWIHHRVRMPKALYQIQERDVEANHD